MAERVAEAEEATTKSKGITLWIVLALAVVAVGAGWFLGGRRSSEAGAQGGGKVSSVMHLDTFVLNLADPDQKAYLRVGIDLALETDFDANKEPERVPTAQVRDVILSVLTQCRPDELLTLEGKSKLKSSLARTLQQRIPRLGVHEVYFTEFLIQR